MKLLRNQFLSVVCAACACGFAHAASMSITFQDSVGGVIIAFSGSVDTAGLDVFATTTNHNPSVSIGSGTGGITDFTFNGEATPFQAATFVGNSVANSDLIDFFDNVAMSPLAANGVGSGDIFDFTMNHNGFFGYMLPAAYVSGTQVSGSATFAGLTVADFEELPGALNGPGTSLSLSPGNSIGFSAIPEPSASLFVYMAAAGMLVLRRRAASR